MGRFLAALTVAAALAALSAPAAAQSADTDAVLKRLEAKVDALAKENAELRARVRKLESPHQTAKANPAKQAAHEAAPPPATVAAPQQILPPVMLVERDPAPAAVPHTGGFIAGAEGMMIKPYYTGDGAPNVDALASDPVIGFVNYPQMPYDFQPGYRGWLGYVDASGWGARLTYFDYHQAATNPGVSAVTLVELGFPGSQSGALTVQSYDLDLTKQLLYGDWNLMAFAGVRWASVHQRSDLQVAGVPSDNFALSYDGIGPTAGLESEAAFAPGSPWSLYLSGRGSLLYGKQMENVTDNLFFYTPGVRSQNAFASTWQLDVGPQWKTPVAGVGYLFVRLTADAQYWQGVGNFAPIGTNTSPFFPVPGLNHNDYNGGFGLLGFTAAVGIQR